MPGGIEMTKKQYLGILVTVAVFGALGGIFSGTLTDQGAVVASEQNIIAAKGVYSDVLATEKMTSGDILAKKIKAEMLEVETIAAKHIAIVDSGMNSKIVLGLDDQGPLIILYGDNPLKGMVLQMAGGNPKIQFDNKKGETTLFLGLTGNNERPVLGIVTEEDTGLFIGIKDEEPAVVLTKKSSYGEGNSTTNIAGDGIHIYGSDGVPRVAIRDTSLGSSIGITSKEGLLCFASAKDFHCKDKRKRSK